MTCYRTSGVPPALSSTVVRDHERCPWRPRLLDYDEDQVTSVPAAAGVAFDSLLRAKLAQHLGRPEVEEDLAWVSPIMRPQARIVGKKLLQAYVRSGAYAALLKEGIVEHDPPRGWGVLAVWEGLAPFVACYDTEENARAAVRAERDDLGHEAYLVAARLDAVVAGPRPDSTRVLDYKTTGTLRGASVPGGYVRRWRGGVDLGPGKEVGRPVAKPEWLDQVGFYGPFKKTVYVGNEVVVVGRGWRVVDVASYRWTLIPDEVEHLLARYLEVGRALLGPEPDVTPGGFCYAYNRLCRVADRCPARRP